MVYNPLDRAADRTVTLPLYYTGISDVARIGEQEQPPREYQLSREYTVDLPVHLKARGRTWFVVESADVKTASEEGESRSSTEPVPIRHNSTFRHPFRLDAVGELVRRL